MTISRTLALITPLIELPHPSFILWERSFHAHPCEAMRRGAFICGHEATFRGRGECEGCSEMRDPVFLCNVHMAAYDYHYIVFHEIPCGRADALLILHDIQRIA